MGQPRWMLVAVEGRFAGKRFPISDAGLRFGREPENEVMLEDDNVSRRHAVIHVASAGLEIEDLKSRNGTFVNNQRVSKQDLKDGDRIALGSHLFKVVPLTEQDSENLAVDPERTVVARHPTRELRQTVSINVNERDALPPPPTRRTRLDGDAQSGSGHEAPSGAILGGAAAVLLDVGRAESPRAPAPAAPTALGMSPVSAPALELAPELPMLSSPPRGELAPAGSSLDPYPPPLDPVPLPLPRKAGRPNILLIGVGTLAVIGIGVFAVSRSASTDAPSTPLPALPSASQSGATSLFAPGGGGGSQRRNLELSAEEKALPEAEKLNRSKEHIDQGESFMESGKLREALEEFEYALALDSKCNLCLLRISKVDSEIKKTLEKYKSDALRSFQAMEYDKAKRYWEMVLELERDPEGQRIAKEGIQKARLQLQQRSYR